MKKFTKIALITALISVLVLSIVVASVAWFTSNPDVDANDVTLDAARTLNVTFSSTLEPSDGFLYCGQIGNAPTGNNAPFVYEAGGFTVRVTPSADSKYGNIKVEFGTVTMSHPRSEVSAILITDLFDVKVNVYSKKSTGDYVKDPDKNYMRAYVEAEDGDEIQRYELISENTIADDGMVMNGAGTAVARFVEGSYFLSFRLTFLPQAAYAVWEDAVAGEDTFDHIYGYEQATSGAYIGVVSYTPYKAKYHYGLTRYSESGGNYTESESGDYVRVVTSYQRYDEVTKYNAQHEESATGTLIKVGNEYLSFLRYNQVNGFPYSDRTYMGASYSFVVACSVEEV